MEPPEDVQGRWALLFQGVADGIGMELWQDGEELTGIGCSWGWTESGARSSLASCGEIVGGKVEAQHLRVEFELMPPLVFQVEAHVSAQGERMTGRVTINGQQPHEPTTWLPFDSSEAWLVVEEVHWPTAIEWENQLPVPIMLLEDSTGAEEFTEGATFEVQRLWDGIGGDLGYFWGTEMTYNVDASGTGIITAGPVAVTERHVPTQLDLHFEAGALTTVEAQTPSGGSYLFGAL